MLGCNGGSNHLTRAECVEQHGVCTCALSQEDQLKHEGKVRYATYGDFALQVSSVSKKTAATIIEENEWQDLVDDPVPGGLCVAP